jgi:hypothetical protein
MDAPDAAPADAVPPFQVICPTCGRDSDAEDTEFLLVFAVPFAGSECLLSGLTCTACGTRVDRVLWPVDTEPLENAVRAAGSPAPEMIGLRARYDRAVAGYRVQWERLYADRGDGLFGARGIDLSAVTVIPTITRKTVVDMRVLAATLTVALAVHPEMGS